MKLSKRQLRRLIKEMMTRIIVDDIHEVPDDLEDMDPHEAYGLGHEAGMEHVDDYMDLGHSCSLEEFVDGSYGMRGRTVPMGAIINEDELEEVAPPGMEKRVKELKGKVDNPYAVAWSEYNKENK